MEPQHFIGLIEKSGASARIYLPFDPNEVWGVKARHHINGMVHGAAIRGPLGVDGERYFISLGAAWLRDHPFEAGTALEVTLSAEGPQSEQLAEDVRAALADHPGAKEFFEALATFYRKGYLRWIDGARKPEVRAARIAEMLALLEAGKKQRD